MNPISTGGDVSEQIVRDSMIILEELTKIAGHFAKETLALLAALIRREWQTKGNTPVTNLKNQALKTEQELTIFSLKKEDIPTFKHLANEYGVLYHKPIYPPVFLTKDGNALVDMVALSGDARGINHILEKLGYPVPERDDAKNAEARAVSKQNSPERGSGYERSRQRKQPNGQPSKAQPGKASDTPAAPSTPDSIETLPASVAGKIKYYKEVSKAKADAAKAPAKTQTKTPTKSKANGKGKSTSKPAR